MVLLQPQISILSWLIRSGSICLWRLWRATFVACPFQTLMVNELMSESNQSGFWCFYVDHFKGLNSRDVNFQQWNTYVIRDLNFVFLPFCFLFWQLSRHRELWNWSCMPVAVCLRVWDCSKIWAWDVGFHFCSYVNKENVSHDES